MLPVDPGINPPQPRWSVTTILLAGVVAALLVGLGEGSWSLYTHYVLHHRSLLGPHVIWMAPLMNLAWFGLVAALLGFIAWRRGGLAPRTVLLVNAALGTFALLLLYGGFYQTARLILAVGIGTAIAGLLEPHSRRIRARLLPLAVMLAALAVLGGVTVTLVTRSVERRTLALRPAPEGDHPNILLLILDTARDWDFSLNGYGRNTTPFLARFATGGVQFDHAWAPSAWTLSSHASMFTGLFPHELTANLGRALDQSPTTLAEQLYAHGYFTGGFVANLHYCNRDFGLAQGFAHYEDLRVTPGEILLNSSIGRMLAVSRTMRRIVGFYDIVARKKAVEVNTELLGWLRRPEVRRGPFFAFVNYYDAHEPYMPPPAYDARFASPLPRKYYLTDQSIRGARRIYHQDMTPAEIQRERDAYDASLAYLDDQIRHLVDSLASLDLLRNTLVVVTSDHGELFGAYGLFGHGNSLYEQLMDVPLIMRLPGRVPAGVVVHDRVNNRNLSRTILDVAGFSADTFPGRSFADAWQPGHHPDPLRPLFFETVTPDYRTLRGVVVGDTEYVRNDKGAEELHLLMHQRETPNLLAAANSTVAVAAFRRRLDSMLTATGPDRWH